MRYFFALLLLLPVSAFASTTYHYTCADLADPFNVTCTGSTATFSGNTGNIKDDAPTSHNLTPSPSTWYMSFTYSGTGTGQYKIAGNVNDGTPVSFSSSPVAVAVSSASGNSSQFIAFYANSNFSGTITNICLTDTSGQCEAAPPAVAIGGATSTLDQAEGNLSTAFLLFFASMFGIVWILRKH